MTKLYAVKDLDSGLYLSEVGGCIFARRKYESYVYELKAAKQVMQDAMSKQQTTKYGFSYSHLAVVSVPVYTVPIVKRSIDLSWSEKVKQGMSFNDAVKGCALEHARSFGSYIRSSKEITNHSFHFACSQL